MATFGGKTNNNNNKRCKPGCQDGDDEDEPRPLVPQPTFINQDCLDIIVEYAYGTAVAAILSLRLVARGFDRAARNTVVFKANQGGQDAACAATVLHLDAQKRAIADRFGFELPRPGLALVSSEQWRQLRRIERLLLLCIDPHHLQRATIHDATAEHIAFVAGSAQLAALDLSKSPRLTAAHVKDVFPLLQSAPAALLRLDLSGCFGLNGDAALEVIAGCLPALQVLKMAGVAGLTALGLGKLAAAPVAAQLVTLDVAGVASVDDAAVDVIAASMTALVVLDVAFTAVSAGGLVHALTGITHAAGHVPPLPQLQQVVVSQGCMEAAAASARLRRLLRLRPMPSHPVAPPTPPVPQPPQSVGRLSVKAKAGAAPATPQRCKQLEREARNAAAREAGRHHGTHTRHPAGTATIPGRSRGDASGGDGGGATIAGGSQRRGGHGSFRGSGGDTRRNACGRGLPVSTPVSPAPRARGGPVHPAPAGSLPTAQRARSYGARSGGGGVAAGGGELRRGRDRTLAAAVADWGAAGPSTVDDAAWDEDHAWQ